MYELIVTVTACMIQMCKLNAGNIQVVSWQVCMKSPNLAKKLLAISMDLIEKKNEAMKEAKTKERRKEKEKEKAKLDVEEKGCVGEG